MVVMSIHTWLCSPACPWFAVLDDGLHGQGQVERALQENDVVPGICPQVLGGAIE